MTVDACGLADDTHNPPDAYNTQTLTSGSLSRHLLRLTGPMSIGVLAVMSVGLADAYFIGRIGALELAAISFIFPVTTALTSLGIGLSAGANAMISQALGSGDRATARRHAAQAIAWTVVLGSCVAIAGLVLWRPLFALLQANGDVLTPIGAYIQVWFFAFPLLTLLLVCNAAIRAHGNTLLPSAVMVLNAIFNIGLDPVLIFGWGPIPAMGIAGAATATFIAFFIAAIAMFWPLLRVVRVTEFADFARRGYLETGRRLAKVGGPASLANALNPAGLSIITAIVARFGPAAVAGFGVAGRIESFVIVPLLALSGSIGPVVGQNAGADKMHRAGRAVGLSAAFCLAYGLLVALLLTLAVEPIVSWFSDSQDVRDSAALYVRIVSWSFCGYGVVVVVNAALNARSSATISMALSLGRIALLYIPLALLGASLFGTAGVYSGALLANLGAGIAAVWLAARYEIFTVR